MELLTNAQMLLVFACSFLVSIWFLRWRAFYRRLPPTPWYIPLLGSPQLYSSSMHLQLTKTGQKYGGIYTLHMTTSPLVVLSSYSAIKAALVRQAVDFSDRFTFPFSSKELRLEGDKHQEEGDKLKEVFREDLIWRAIHDMFAAGTDTTTYTILWLILLMMEYPDVQTKVQSEVDNVIGQSRPPSLTDRAQMPYTEATLMEVQRFRTVAPYVPPRAVPRDVEIMGYSIPKGTQVWVNLWGALNDPSHWSNPECFDPSRFLSDDGEHVIVPEAYIPFGAGRRACLGETLAKMELFLFCTNFMQRFTFIRNSTTPLDLSGRIGITFIPRSYETVVVRR
ncbi:cytochrome P450 2A11-like isoform X2 [Acanthaster planci]|uniref:Cytochrome P450 2A11-like isoform X2 n=1 Tax=Acanthaster planci TaxID=133434 RepID=A0A8B7ZF34_ACAPL|nr:cytochrome P450 2A11-like isoform X2 [Acanthaster planci]